MSVMIWHTERGRRHLSELKVGELLTDVWADLVDLSFTWRASKEGQTYWEELYDREREVTPEDYSRILEILKLPNLTKPVALEDVL